MISAVGKSREITRIRREMAAGHHQAAVRRLQTLAAVDPTDREVYDLLVQIHRDRGDLVGAGRWGFLTDAATPDEICAFERAHPSPWVRLRLLRWFGDPDDVENLAGRTRLTALTALAEQSGQLEPVPSPLAWIPSSRRPAESEPGFAGVINAEFGYDVEPDHAGTTGAAMAGADAVPDAQPADDQSAGSRRALRKANRQAERERRRALRREVRTSTLISVTMIMLLLALGAAGSLGVVDTMRVIIARFASMVIS